jgi:lysophospholipase L1-like esterase
MKKHILLKIVLPVLCSLIVLAGILWYALFYLPAEQQRQEHKQAVQQYWDQKFAVYAAENEQYADYEVDVAFLGDSLTDLYPLEEYYPQFTVSNRGIGGDTTFNLEDRLQLSVYDLKPKVAVMLIGGNNVQNMFDNYESILQGLQKNLPQTKIVLISLTPMGGDWAYKNEISAYNNVKIRLLAEKYGFSFVDIYTPMFDLQTGMVWQEYTVDSVHLSPEGFRVFTDVLTPVLEQLLSGS